MEKRTEGLWEPEVVITTDNYFLDLTEQLIIQTHSNWDRNICASFRDTRYENGERRWEWSSTSTLEVPLQRLEGLSETGLVE